MATINIRIDEELKEKTNHIFNELGMNMSTAITMFLKAVERNNGFPFPLEIPNKKTLKAMKETEDIIAGKRKSKIYKNVEELSEDLNE